MYMKSFIGLIAAALLIMTVPAFATNSNTNNNSATLDVASLLNKAHQINKSEEDMAGLLNDKAGNNLTLTTLAKTLKDDHQDNDAAVQALANNGKH